MEIVFPEKIRIWTLGVAFTFALVSCASVPPQGEILSPPPTETSSLPQEVKTEPGGEQKVSPLAKEPAPLFTEAPSVSKKPVPAKEEPPKAATEIPESPSSPPLPDKAEPKSQETSYRHKVKWNGETLSIIALWYTGDTNHWKTIAQANPGMNPHRIFDGSEILIPETLMKTREPLPKEYVDRFFAKGRKEKPKAREEEPKLFGPKKSSK